MNIKEIKAMRNVFANFGFEYTPDQVAKADFMDKLEQVKIMFKSVQPHVKELKAKFDLGIINIENFADELSHRIGRKITEDDCQHYLLMESVFEYDE